MIEQHLLDEAIEYGRTCDKRIEDMRQTIKDQSTRFQELQRRADRVTASSAMSAEGGSRPNPGQQYPGDQEVGPAMQSTSGGAMPSPKKHKSHDMEAMDLLESLFLSSNIGSSQMGKVQSLLMRAGRKAARD